MPKRVDWFDDSEEDRANRVNVRCAGLTALFYPDDEGTMQARHAKAICEGTFSLYGVKPWSTPCPVKDWCRERAIEWREQGIWGGTTTRERRIEIRRRKKERKDAAKEAASGRATDNAPRRRQDDDAAAPRSVGRRAAAGGAGQPAPKRGR